MREYDPHYWLIDVASTDGIGGAVVPGDGTPAVGRSGPVIYVAVENLEDAVERTGRLGGTIEPQPTAIGDGTRFALVHPFGTRLGLWCRADP